MNNNRQVKETSISIAFLHSTRLGFLPPQNLIPLQEFVQLPLGVCLLSQAFLYLIRILEGLNLGFRIGDGREDITKGRTVPDFQGFFSFFERETKVGYRIKSSLPSQEICVMSIAEGSHSHIYSNLKGLEWHVALGEVLRRRGQWSEVIAVR